MIEKYLKIAPAYGGDKATKQLHARGTKHQWLCAAVFSGGGDMASSP